MNRIDQLDAITLANNWLVGIDPQEAYIKPLEAFSDTLDASIRPLKYLLIHVNCKGIFDPWKASIDLLEAYINSL